MTKVISLSNDAYARLKSLKQEGESFSDVVVRIGPKRQNLLRFLGKWPGPAQELDRLEREAKEGRKNLKLRETQPL